MHFPRPVQELANERKTLLGSDSLSDVAKAYIEAHSSADSVPSSACSHASLVSACVAAVEVDAGLTDLAVSTLCGVLSSKVCSLPYCLVLLFLVKMLLTALSPYPSTTVLFDFSQT